RADVREADASQVSPSRRGASSNTSFKPSAARGNMVAMARLRFLALLLVVACDKPEPAASPEPEPTTKQAIAPSGTYAIAVRVLGAPCSPAPDGPPPWQARVLVRAEQGKAKVNLPLSMLSASGPSRATARSDFRLEPGYSAEHTSTPKLGCDDYRVD